MCPLGPVGEEGACWSAFLLVYDICTTCLGLSVGHAFICTTCLGLSVGHAFICTKCLGLSVGHAFLIAESYI